jgi:hypothetical protein
MSRTCLHCGREFEPRRADERLCGFECRRLRQLAQAKANYAKRKRRRLSDPGTAETAPGVGEDDGR